MVATIWVTLSIALARSQRWGGTIWGRSALIPDALKGQVMVPSRTSSTNASCGQEVSPRQGRDHGGDGAGDHEIDGDHDRAAEPVHQCPRQRPHRHRHQLDQDHGPGQKGGVIDAKGEQDQSQR